MSTIYSVIPFDKLGDRDLADMHKYLDEHGLEYPPDADRSRYPTQNEIEQVLRSFGSYEVELHPDDSVDTNKPWSQASLVKRAQPDSEFTFEDYATLSAVDPPRDKDSPCRFYLCGGSQNLNYAVLEQLAYRSGPLFCITEGECDAVIFHRKRSNTNPSPSFAANHHSPGKGG